MSEFVIPKKSSVSLKFPTSFSPKLHESFILKSKTGETAKAGELKTKLTSGPFGILPFHVGVPSCIPEARLTDRQKSSVKTILKTGSKGGFLRALGTEIVDGPKTMKNFQIRISTLDNKKIFKSLGIPPRKVVKNAVKTLSKKEQNALMESYIVKRQKVKQRFQPKALKAATIHVEVPKAPKVAKHTIQCTHIHRMIRSPNGPAKLQQPVAKSYKVKMC
jgi:hypothetical protein